ncbi:MAG: hypothetical protein AAGA29_07310 [Planctomycetota bacterium]
MDQDHPPTEPPREPAFGIEATPTTSAGHAMGVRTHTGYAPPASNPRQKVAEHVRLLGILTWVYAGLELLSVLFGLVYAGIGLFLVTNPPADLVQQSQADPNAMPPTLLGWVLFGAGVFVVLLTGTLTLLTVLTARDLMRHRRRVFCMVIAGIHCLNIPLGMVLGIFTIMVLCKPEAKALFEQDKAEA